MKIGLSFSKRKEPRSTVLAVGICFVASLFAPGYAENSQSLLGTVGNLLNGVNNLGQNISGSALSRASGLLPSAHSIAPVQQSVLSSPILPGPINVSTGILNVPGNVLNMPMTALSATEVCRAADLNKIQINANSKNATAPVAPGHFLWTTPSLSAAPGIQIVEDGLSRLPVSLENITVSASARSNFNETRSGYYSLESGTLLFSPHTAGQSLLVNTAVGKIWIGQRSDVIVSINDGVLRVQNLDSVGKNVRVQLNESPRHTFAVRPGYELVASDRRLDWDILRPADGIGRRNQVLIKENNVAVSEINLAHIIKNQPVVSVLKAAGENNQRRIYNRILKTAAVLQTVRGAAGFNAVPLAHKVVSGVVRNTVQPLVAAVENAGDEVLSAVIPGGGAGQGAPPNIPPITPSEGSSSLPPSSAAQNGQISSLSTSGAAFSASLLAASAVNTSNIARNDVTRPQALQLAGKKRKSGPASIKFADKVEKKAAKVSNRATDAVENSVLKNPSLSQSGQAADKAGTSGSLAASERKNRVGGIGTAKENIANPAYQTAREAFLLAKESIRRFPELVLAAGLIILSLLIVSVNFARQAFLRSRQLAATNLRLAQVNEELAAARDRALESSRLKSEFVANISHEIRTPITAVIGMNQLLSNTKLDDTQKEFVGLVEKSAQSLLTVINDILDFSKIEAGKLEISSVAFSLGSVLNEVADVLNAGAKEKGISLMLFVEPAVDKVVRGDPARLRQVLLNLAGNAIKFTAAGTVTVRAQMASEHGYGAQIRFSVKDSGIGIPESFQNQLFQPFVQADGSSTRRYGGTGLGLAISKKLVDLMGGRIQVESEEGRGSTFWFDLPLLTETAKTETGMALSNSADEGVQNAGAVGAGITVLVAEDSPVLQRMAKTLLEKLGCEVRIASNGKEALEALKQKSYNLVFMDWQMPEMDGLAATRLIRNQEELAGGHIPIIAMTANAMQGDKDTCMEAGMDDYLSKPFNLEDLSAIVKKYGFRADKKSS